MNYKKLLKNKRAESDNLKPVGAIIIIVLLVVFIFGFIMINSWGNTLVEEFSVEFTEANGYTNESIAAITTAENTYPGVVDSIGMFVIVGLWVLVFVLAYNSNAHPLLAFLSIILVVILGLVGMILGNAWEEMLLDPDFSDNATTYPMMNFVLGNYLAWVLVFGFTMVLGFFLGSRNV